MDREDENIGSFYMGRSRPSPERKRLLPPGALTTILLLSLLGIIWYAYPHGAERYEDVDVPVVKADTTPIRVEPAEPGGMEVRHQDSTVFDPLEKNAGGEVEKLLSAPEEPVDRAAMGKSVIVKPDVPSEMDAKLNLDMQMKDAGNGTEKVVPIQPPAPPVTADVTEPTKIVGAPKEVVKEAPKPAPAASGKYKIQLGSYRDPADVKKEGDRMKKKYPEFLGQLAMKTVTVDLPGKGVYHRLYAAGVTQERAKEICAALKMANGGCLVSKQ